MKYVITGGAGFIGSNLVDKLVLDGNEVHVLDNFFSGRKENCNEHAYYHKIDISDESNLDQIVNILQNVDTVFHMACMARVQPSIINPIKFEKNNSLGTSIILKASVQAEARRFVYSSSSSVYGNNKNLPLVESFEIDPLSPYGAQKYYGEVLCKTFHKVYGLETVSLRYFNVYGEKQNISGAYALVLGIFLNQKMENKPLTIRGSGEQKRDFTYVGDVVRANILASSSNNVGSGEVINIGNGDNRSINQIANLVGGEKIHVDPVIEPFETLANIEKAKMLLSWEPSISIEEWYEKSYNKKS